MPELPEVETVRRGLEKAIGANQSIYKIRFLSPSLRSQLPKARASLVESLPIRQIKRRAKYLLFVLTDYTLVSHLGMTGSWRFENFSQLSDIDENPKLRDHDHIELSLDDGRVLVFRDPRRFGQFDILQGDYQDDPRFLQLGPEPLDSSEFHSDYLYAITRDRKTPIKSLIMDQRVVVGVGNIYASESLFLAGINPLRKAGKLSRQEAHDLVLAIREVLEDAIEFGGTTISDFRQAGGSGGYFQNILLVYDQADQPCAHCDETITSRVIAGRSTYWCPKCQSL